MVLKVDIYDGQTFGGKTLGLLYCGILVSSRGNPVVLNCWTKVIFRTAPKKELCEEDSHGIFPVDIYDFACCHFGVFAVRTYHR